jgi:hypothetical protein
MKFLTFARWPGIYVALIHHGKSISRFSRHNIVWWKRAISNSAYEPILFNTKKIVDIIYYTITSK